MNNQVYDKAHNDCSLRKLRNLLRELGLKSVRSEMEYSLRDLYTTMNADMGGKADQIVVDYKTFASLNEILSKDKAD